MMAGVAVFVALDGVGHSPIGGGVRRRARCFATDRVLMPATGRFSKPQRRESEPV